MRGIWKIVNIDDPIERNCEAPILYFGHLELLFNDVHVRSCIFCDVRKAEFGGNMSYYASY